jgi:hypothetical protein
MNCKYTPGCKTGQRNWIRNKLTMHFVSKLAPEENWSKIRAYKVRKQIKKKKGLKAQGRAVKVIWKENREARELKERDKGVHVAI